MSETRTDCDRFDQWLLEGFTTLDGPMWADHLDACAECRDQWHAHQMLVVAFAEEEVPELSPAFEAGLDRKLASVVEIRPLSGWRTVAMLAYVAAALSLLGWALQGVPLPTIDLSARWVAVVALIGVPLSFMLAITASRWLPGRGLVGGLRMFAL